MLWTPETIYNIPIKEIPHGLGMIIYCNGRDYAAVNPGVIIKPCQKLPTPLTSTGGDESLKYWNCHWNVLPALAGVMNEPSVVIY